MALREITYTQSNKDRAFADDEEYIISARQEHGVQFEAYLSWLTSNRIGRVNARYTSTSVPGVPNVAVISFFNTSGQPESGIIKNHDGLYEDANQFVKTVNERLALLYDRSFTHEPAYFYLVDDGGPFKKVKLNWNYARGYWRQIAFLPILGDRNRRLLSIPEHNSAAMVRLLSKIWDGRWADLELGPEGMTQAHDNMFVLCDLIQTTGARPHMEGKILRAIPNQQKPEGTVVHFNFNDDYFNTTPKSTFFSVHIRLVSTRNYRDLNLTQPTSLTLHFTPVDQCQPIAKRTVV